MLVVINLFKMNTSRFNRVLIHLYKFGMFTLQHNNLKSFSAMESLLNTECFTVNGSS